MIIAHTYRTVTELQCSIKPLFARRGGDIRIIKGNRCGPSPIKTGGSKKEASFGDWACRSSIGNSLASSRSTSPAQNSSFDPIKRDNATGPGLSLYCHDC